MLQMPKARFSLSLHIPTDAMCMYSYYSHAHKKMQDRITDQEVCYTPLNKLREFMEFEATAKAADIYIYNIYIV